MIFQCNRCPSTFLQFKELVKHYETYHNLEGEQFEKFKDAVGYAGSDSGCDAATEYLGYQSSCLKCPFRKCVFDEPFIGVQRAKKRNRNEEIIQRWMTGESVANLAVAFNVHQRTVWRIVKSTKEVLNA